MGTPPYPFRPPYHYTSGLRFSGIARGRVTETATRNYSRGPTANSFRLRDQLLRRGAVLGCVAPVQGVVRDTGPLAACTVCPRPAPRQGTIAIAAPSSGHVKERRFPRTSTTERGAERRKEHHSVNGRERVTL